MRTFLIALAALTSAGSAPAFALDAMGFDQMASHDQMIAARPMTAEMKAITACNAKGHAAMMKDRRYAKLVAAHPEVMNHDAMMSSGK